MLARDVREYAYHQFMLYDTPEGSEVRTIDQLRRAAEFNEQALVDLEGPPMPEIAGDVWPWWCDLHEHRGQGMSGILPLKYESIVSYFALRGIEFSPLIELILTEIERAYIRFAAKKPLEADEDEASEWLILSS